MATRLDRWLAPRIASRRNDAMQEIADDPTFVAWYRGNAQLGTLTVRIASAMASAFSRTSTQYSQATNASVTILAPANTLLKVRDRLQKEGGETWLITAVSPDKSVRTEALGEVSSV